jgi:hypothetical protein
MKSSSKRPSRANGPLALGLASVLAVAPSVARAQSTPEATTDVKIRADWEGVELIRHLGTSYGYGTVGGRAASITTIHLERICRLPCTATLENEGSYVVDGPGMNPRAFELSPGARTASLSVRGASQWPLTLSAYGVVIGGVTALTGGLLWGLFAASDSALDTSPYQAMTYAGAGALVLGVAALILLPKTHVEEPDGARLDARAATPTGPRFTGNGFTF